MKTNHRLISVLLSILGGTLHWIDVEAQGLYNNGASIVIPSGTYIYIDGDGSGNYLNEDAGGASDGEIDIDGTIIVEGDWTNNSANNVFINRDNDGTVKLKGTTTQTVGGTGTTTFENLTINNNIAAGSAVSLSVNATVGNALTLTDGVTSTGANYLIMTSTTAGNLLPATPTDASFVNGNLRRYITSNTNTYAFPVGDGTATTNFYLAELINGSLTGITYIDSKFATLVAGGTLGVTEEGTAYTSVATEGVWYLDPNSAPSGGNYDLKCYTANFSGLDDNKFSILSRPTASSDAANWTCSPCGFGDPGLNANGGAGRMVADGYALRLGMTGFSQKGLGKTPVPLPIELISFYSKCEDDGVRISWVTASESNNDYFTIEKSTNGTDFIMVEMVNGAGTSNNILYYNLFDEEISEMNTYYRLKQTDLDGEFTYSEMVIINCFKDEEDVGFAIMPNPARDHINVVLKGGHEDAVLMIFDGSGRRVHINQMVRGKKRMLVYVGGFAPGMYYVRLITGNKMFTEKLIKL